LVYFLLLIYNLRLQDVHYIIRKFNIRRGDQKRIYSFIRLHRKLFKSLAKSKLTPSQIFAILEPLSYEVIILIKAISPKEIIKKRIGKFFSFYNGVRLHIKGTDLVELGIKPGANFKDVLKNTLFAKIDGKLKSKSGELRFVKKFIGK